MRAFVSAGSNVEPRRNLAQAVAEMRRRFAVVAISPVYLTVPVGDVEQPDFWNLAVEIASELEPAEIQRELHEVERLIGRKRDPRRPFGPRSIDLDLVLVEGRGGTFGAIELPSPQLSRCSFIAVPLADLAPDLPHPGLGVSIGELARHLVMADQRPPQRLAVGLAE